MSVLELLVSDRENEDVAQLASRSLVSIQKFLPQWVCEKQIKNRVFEQYTITLVIKKDKSCYG